ncbi:MAG: 3-methylornithyl-N6-L-lysine dehydrogenase PylD [Planctomycetes bacterium]|nr:3-methylornithyl-N6-L-lysine dehydrogenase PylD [Planctomycetota bacterium]
MAKSSKHMKIFTTQYDKLLIQPASKTVDWAHEKIDNRIGYRMTRLCTEDIEHIRYELKTYDQQLVNRTGKTLKGIAFHAFGLPDSEFEEIIKSNKVCVIPLTCGQGIIKSFSATVSGIISHLGFHSLVTQNTDAAGIAEAFEQKSDIIFLADDSRFVAINVHTKHVSDNNEMTAKSFVAGLDLMAGGSKGKKALVIGCGSLGSYAAKALVKKGVLVSVYDILPQCASALQKEIADELKTIIQIDNDWRSTPGEYQYIIDATPSANIIEASMITSDTYVAVPGVPCGLSSEVRKKISNRYIHDPLQLGVAAMVIDACIQ